MRYYSKLKQYKASNLIYDETTETGYSYEWYEIIKRINGLMVFNVYNYSPTTIRHYYKIRKLMDKLGIKIDFELNAPRGLQRLDLAVAHYLNEIKDLQKQIDKPRSQKNKNLERLMLIRTLKDKIDFIKNNLIISE